MNLSVAIFLVNKSVRPVRVAYDPDIPKNNNPNTLFKTLDETLKVDDFVVVPTNTRHGMTVCKVTDIGFRVNFDSHDNYGWIIGKVDTPAYEDILKQEATVVDRIGQAEENRKRAELAVALGLQDIDLTDLDVVSGKVRIPAPPTPRGEQSEVSAEEPKT